MQRTEAAAAYGEAPLLALPPSHPAQVSRNRCPALCISDGAGAKKVYAVEATDMAKLAKRLVAAQGLEGTVEVIQGVIESVHIPEKVDIIISEWMVRRGARLLAALLVSHRTGRKPRLRHPQRICAALAPLHEGAVRARCRHLLQASTVGRAASQHWLGPWGPLPAGRHGHNFLPLLRSHAALPAAPLLAHAPVVAGSFIRRTPTMATTPQPHPPSPPSHAPQGYFLLRESMLDSVLVARDRFLKPGGALYPSHARMYLAPIRSNIWWAGQQAGQPSLPGWCCGELWCREAPSVPGMSWQ